MHHLVADARPEFERTLEHARGEVAAVRGNRAHPGLVEDVAVDAYGTSMRVKELASITLPEPRTIQVQPWDKGLLKPLERALQTAALGAGVKNDGEVLHVTLPPLTAETRAELLKVLHQKIEQGRVQLRQVREKTREAVMAAEREKAMTEDDRHEALADIDATTKEYVERLDEIGAHKEHEITTV